MITFKQWATDHRGSAMNDRTPRARSRAARAARSNASTI